MAGAGLYTSMPSPLRGSSLPSDTVNIGVIGVGFGLTNMRHMLSGNSWVHCTALCDVDREKLEAAAAELRERLPEQTANLTLYTDFRRLLEDADIDGVIIATPDHWHTYMYAEACQAGKAIYIEKPTGHTVQDCDLMVDLQRKHNNVVTTGLWHISLGYFVDAFEILRSGVLGDVYKAHAWITGGTTPVAYGPPPPVPATFDYEMWVGPAPSRPYAPEVVSNWRQFWDFGGGRQTDWVHYLDSALDGIAALGHERAYPRSVYSVGYKHPDTIYEAPAMQTSVFEFDDYHIVWEHQVTNLYNRGDGVAWIGSNGTLVCNRTGYEILPQSSGGSPLIAPTRVQGSYGNQSNHMANWAECIRDSNPNTNSPIEKGAYASVLANLANISYRTGSPSLEYLPGERRFRDNPEADALLVSNYRNNWAYPQL
jgi:predicted dehydrogenase